MKRVMFALAIVTAFTFASCGGSNEEAATCADSTAVCDSVNCTKDSTIITVDTVVTVADTEKK